MDRLLRYVNSKKLYICLVAIGQKRIITSFVLLGAFLYAALGLPIVSSSSVKKELPEIALKATSHQSGANAQLPPAEKENEEEENGSRKEQDVIADLVSTSIDFTFFLTFRQSTTHQFTPEELQKQLPLYLYKRYLLI